MLKQRSLHLLTVLSGTLVLLPVAITTITGNWASHVQIAGNLQDWKEKLGKDPQKRADPKTLPHNELRELFGMYVHNLRGQIQQGYRALMDQVSLPHLLQPSHVI